MTTVLLDCFLTSQITLRTAFECCEQTHSECSIVNYVEVIVVYFKIIRTPYPYFLIGMGKVYHENFKSEQLCIPDGIFDICLNPSRPTMVLGSTQPVTEKSIRDIPWG